MLLGAYYVHYTSGSRAEAATSATGALRFPSKFGPSFGQLPGSYWVLKWHYNSELNVSYNMASSNQCKLRVCGDPPGKAKGKLQQPDANCAFWNWGEVHNLQREV